MRMIQQGCAFIGDYKLNPRGRRVPFVLAVAAVVCGTDNLFAEPAEAENRVGSNGGTVVSREGMSFSPTQ